MSITDRICAKFRAVRGVLNWPDITLTFRIALLLLSAIITSVSYVKTDNFELPKSDFPEGFFEENITSIAAVKVHYNISIDELYTFRDTQTQWKDMLFPAMKAAIFTRNLFSRTARQIPPPEFKSSLMMLHYLTPMILAEKPM